VAAAGAQVWFARLGIPQRVLAVLGASLIVVGVVELLFDGWVWLYPVHIGAGVVALGVAPLRRLVKPAALVLGALFLFLYLFESANPNAADDVPQPASNATLILTGVVLVALMVTLMWPLGDRGRRAAGSR
jgi:hypothetical protein